MPLVQTFVQCKVSLIPRPLPDFVWGDRASVRSLYYLWHTHTLRSYKTSLILKIQIIISILHSILSGQDSSPPRFTTLHLPPITFRHACAGGAQPLVAMVCAPVYSSLATLLLCITKDFKLLCSNVAYVHIDKYVPSPSLAFLVSW